MLLVQYHFSKNYISYAPSPIPSSKKNCTIEPKLTVPQIAKICKNIFLAFFCERKKTTYGFVAAPTICNLGMNYRWNDVNPQTAIRQLPSGPTSCRRSAGGTR